MSPADLHRLRNEVRDPDIRALVEEAARNGERMERILEALDADKSGGNGGGNGGYDDGRFFSRRAVGTAILAVLTGIFLSLVGGGVYFGRAMEHTVTVEQLGAVERGIREDRTDEISRLRTQIQQSHTEIGNRITSLEAKVDRHIERSGR